MPATLFGLENLVNMDALNIDPALNTRLQLLNQPNKKQAGKCVLYIMSRDQRVHDNHALIIAQKHALAKSLPLAVVFVLRKKSGYRSKEHYLWMIDGLREVERKLADKNIPLMLLIGDPYERIVGCIKHLKPDAIYFDMNPLRGPRNLQRRIASLNDCLVGVVDTHNIVPVWVATDKQEIGARTLRPKIHRLLDTYLVEPDDIIDHPCPWTGTIMTTEHLQNRISFIIDGLQSNGQDLSAIYLPGEAAGLKRVRYFIQNRLKSYFSERNDPSIDGLSGMSPYLHFGQTSALRVALEALRALDADSNLQTSVDALLEEMVVRKELSDNFCYFNQDYDTLRGAPNWAQTTLAKHTVDPREFIYSTEEFENAQTHDPAWNAAQKQMLKTGKMHGYMRMYWAKKVLEWSESPETAVKTLIYLNDFYSIDGGDPNGYVGILWSVGGLHDRPWGERPVYGTIRSMVYNGLKRKFDVEKYIAMYN